MHLQLLPADDACIFICCQQMAQRAVCLRATVNPYDVQIHVLDGGKKVHIYSRNAEDMTPRYPDILARLSGWLAPGTKSIVIDGEAVAWDPHKGKILPFQVMLHDSRRCCQCACS